MARFTISLSIDIDGDAELPGELEHWLPGSRLPQSLRSQQSYVEGLVDEMVAAVAPWAEFGYARIDIDTGRRHPDFEYRGRRCEGTPIFRTVSISAPAGTIWG